MIFCEKNFVARKKASENLVTVQIAEDVNEAMNKYCGTTRIKRGTIGEVLKWFLRQPGYMQQVIVGEEVREWRAVYAATLRDMAKRLESDESIADVVHLLALPDFSQSSSAKGHPSGPRPATAQSGKHK